MLQRPCFPSRLSPSYSSYFQYLTITETTTRSSAIPATNLSTTLPTLSSPNTSGHGYGWKSTSRVGRAPTARPHSIRPCAPRSVLLLEMFFRRSHHIDDWCKVSQNHFAGFATFRSLLTSVRPCPLATLQHKDCLAEYFCHECFIPVCVHCKVRAGCAHHGCVLQYTCEREVPC